MKLNTTLLPAVAGLLATLTLPLCAQNIHLKGDIPFEFSVRGQVMPAGTYTIEERGSGSSQPCMMAVLDQARKQKALFLVQPVTANQLPDQPKLVFTRVRDRYFLSQVWTTDSTQGHQLIKSREERELIARVPAVEQQGVTILAKR